MWTFIVMMMTMTMTMKTMWAMETTATTERTATAMDGRTKNYFSTLDERELFDALRERTVVLGLFVPHCELCAAYVDEFRYAAELFEKKDEETSMDASSSVVFVEVPDARATPNAPTRATRRANDSREGSMRSSTRFNAPWTRFETITSDGDERGRGYGERCRARRAPPSTRGKTRRRARRRRDGRANARWRSMNE